jgi:DNA polymerase-3 subunit delta'
MLHPVWGHEEVRGVLGRARRSDRFPSALLLHGPRGVGKQRLALWAGQLLLCERPGEAPCDACHSCRLALRLQHPDLHWHFPLARPKGVAADRLGDALEQERADQLERWRASPVGLPERVEGGERDSYGIYLAAVQTIRRRAQSRPAMSAEQVFVIGEAEELVTQEASQEAANALLKLLEEPPRGTRLILTSSQPGRLLPTVRSRTVPIHVGPLRLDDVRRFLAEHAGVADAEAERAARAGLGSIGRALGFLPGEKGEPGPLDRKRRQALGLLRAALSPRREDAFALALSFPATGARHLAELLDFLDEAIRDLGTLAAGAPERVADPAATELVGRGGQGAAVHPSDAARALGVVERARELARGNVNPQLLVAGLTAELRRTLLAAQVGAGATP